MELPELISSLKKSYSNFPNIKFIIQKLEEMDSMIEMNSVKSAFAAQLALILTMARRGYKPPFKKMHSVLSGPPGVGKTTMSILMAEIWSLLKLTDKKSFSFEQYSGSKKIPDKEDLVEEKRTIAYVMNEVQDKIFDIIRIIDNEHGKDDIGKIPENIRKIYTKSSDSADLCQEIIDKYAKYFMQIDDSEPDTSSEQDYNIKPYIVLGRQDFVGTHQGHTVQKTEKILKENKGKVIIIEEAYLLSTDPKDSYGMEALTIINRYMDEHSDDYIFILNGYEELLDRTIFKVQPGLRRRIQWTFTVDNYSYKGLYNIFLHQLSKYNKPHWKIDKNEEKKYIEFFRKNKEKFPHFGGDTERLILNIQMEYAKSSFDKHIDNLDEIVIDFETFYLGYKTYIENIIIHDNPLKHMFI